jgi:hypothetical protein
MHALFLLLERGDKNMASSETHIGFCGNCGKPLYAGQLFCPNCGSKVEIENSPSLNRITALRDALRNAQAKPPQRPQTPPVAPRKETKMLKGHGQQASQKFKLQVGLATFYMTHTGIHHFSVTLLNERGQRIALLANKVGSFNGSKALGIQQPGVYLLDIHADGNWTVKIEQ